MADPVAIISVIGTSTVGLAGVLTNFFGGAAQRRWQSRESRIAELRDVLDIVASNIAATMQPIALANVALTTRAIVGEPNGGPLTKEAVAHLKQATAQQPKIWALSNRVRVREGSSSAVALALKEAEKEIGLLGAVVRTMVVNPASGSFEEQWAKAEAAERAFYDAAAEELRTAEDKSKRTAHLLGPG